MELLLTSPITNVQIVLGKFLAALSFFVVMLLPTPAGLPVAGQSMLAILAFAVIVWMTEALDYAVSAVVIAALMAFLEQPVTVTGTVYSAAGTNTIEIGTIAKK